MFGQQFTNTNEMLQEFWRPPTLGAKQGRKFHVRIQ